MNSEFKKSIPFETRKLEAERILSKYPDRIPCILERARNSTLKQSDKKKFLVPNNLTIGQFIYIIRKRIKLASHEAIFLFINGNILVPTSSVLESIYNDYKCDDLFLYFIYTNENTFGSLIGDYRPQAVVRNIYTRQIIDKGVCLDYDNRSRSLNYQPSGHVNGTGYLLDNIL